MTATVLDGKSTASDLRETIAEEVHQWLEQGHARPTLAAVLVGDDPASQVYVRNKERACEKAGMHSRLIRKPADTTTAQLLELLQELNGDPAVHGILVQLPLPASINTQQVLDAVSPLKDVDAFAPENVGLLVQGRPRYLPCTPHGVIQLLVKYGLEFAGKHVVIVGRSDIVGKPLANMMVQRDLGFGPQFANATVTLCHSQSENLAAITRTADVLVAAVGRPCLITADMVKLGSIVIDVGINRVNDKLVGDVDYTPVSELAAAITPVPGGIGPLTIAMLLRNTLTACQLQAQGQQAKQQG
ncbi:bifunctional 5,10-methylenetetrahydrofolate dehydrogenase/5,10-methenyltetrahydrofolate cyclohydrolase [Aureliella helgolandensis]|uniref:Bifunctional protein FolD n=1 Tax=Aureliella helgolandensis TaxID=2527968 RepID=A0A518G6L9_9BACT|nr:bifunctional 5,10-methylenetetrahydrofolate dehydrogenase/5,10-methenyltetrahydrofolate cyclohydrolase [Aureliella helgolandensis]QDV24238.1 Tetrahydrofolate dehydrogenase/cyclohydrolase [Aureliella helgolandensis]